MARFSLEKRQAILVVVNNDSVDRWIFVRNASQKSGDHYFRLFDLTLPTQRYR